MLLPGELVASEEEFLPGEGVYAEGGKLRAAAVGEAVAEGKVVSVWGKAKPLLRPGDKVLGMVTEVYEKALGVLIHSPKARASSFGLLRIDSMAPFFVKDVRDIARIGDIILARVISRSPDGTYLLSTRDADLGVLLAFCSVCRRKMVRTGRAFFCPHCRRLEKRKVPLAWSENFSFYSQFFSSSR